MEKRGQVIGIVIVSIIVMAIVFGAIAWIQFKGDKNNPTSTNYNGTLQNKPAVNNTIPAVNNPNQTNPTNQTNQTLNNTSLVSNLTPNPTGSVIIISREDSSGEYFCNKTIDPTHAVRVYTYKIIEGTKNLSEKYISSKKINVCDDYKNETVYNGITYNIEWKWDAVEGVDGYKVYQYYLNKNVSRNYSSSIDVKTNRILDTSLDLWR